MTIHNILPLYWENEFAVELENDQEVENDEYGSVQQSVPNETMGGTYFSHVVEKFE
jgi:hypothetical protein